MSFETPQASFSLNGRIKLSAQFRELYGIGAGQTSLEQVMSRIYPDDYERVVHAMEKGFMSGAPMRETYRVVRPDSTVLHLEGQHETDRDEKGYVKRIFGTVQDVTERIESRKQIERALAEIAKLKDQLQEENLYLREEIRAAHGFDKIIGNSPKLNSALKSVEKVAPTDVTVMILGETGTGKELIAQAIHDLSGRKNNALISVNCAALSKDLIESELFGHEKGAFTGAHSQRKGRFELADGGTLFLDEIGELPGELQAKLLRVLETGDFERLGGSETLHVDARLITATNRNIKRAVDEGEFRADLYYRINSFPIELPPLHERAEDIPALTEFFVQRHAKRMSKDIESISARTIRYLCKQKWPGNIRELEGFIQRALISTSGPVLDYSESHDSEPESSISPDSVPANASADLRNVEREHIFKVLKSTRWVVAGKHGAAMIMGVPPSTLRSMMKRLGIKRAP
jgi:transcriptional regulator with GAF, ATPase, and Fis domain